MSRVLILLAHPALQKSRVNVRLWEAVRDLPDVTRHDLYEAYPDFFIDVPREQTLLLEHDVIVFQHPLYWYSTPPMVKQWEDLVLEHGWAYGSQGTELRGKKWASMITSGGGLDAYQRDGYNHYTLRELLRPLEQTAVLCGMEFVPPCVAAGTHSMTDEAASGYADNYVRLIEALRDDQFDYDRAASLELLNDGLDLVIPRTTEVSDAR